jgi:hypothetical protein
LTKPHWCKIGYWRLEDSKFRDPTEVFESLKVNNRHNDCTADHLTFLLFLRVRGITLSLAFLFKGDETPIVCLIHFRVNVDEILFSDQLKTTQTQTNVKVKRNGNFY